MPLAWLVPLITVSVALIGGLTWWMGWSGAAALDEHTARQRFLQDWPEAHIQSLTLGKDRLAALLWLGAEAGLVFTVGDRFATRKLGCAQILPVQGGLQIEFADFGAPRVHIELEGQDLTTWRERLCA